MLSLIHGAAILRHRESNVRQIVNVTGALLKNAGIGGIFARNCDSDVSNLRHTRYINQIPLDTRRMFERACDVSGLRH